MTVVESPKGRASHNLGNRGAIPPFPPPGYCYIFFQKPIPKGVFLTACTFSLQAHSSIRKDCPPPVPSGVAATRTCVTPARGWCDGTHRRIAGLRPKISLIVSNGFRSHMGGGSAVGGNNWRLVSAPVILRISKGDSLS